MEIKYRKSNIKVKKKNQSPQPPVTLMTKIKNTKKQFKNKKTIHESRMTQTLRAP
jgi:hypothetical protein